VLAAAFRGIEASATATALRTAPREGNALDLDVLRSVPVDVAVNFPAVAMTPAAILGIAVGDVIALQPVAEPLELSAGDVRIGWVQPAQHAGRTACQVTSLDHKSPLVRS